MTKVYTKTGDSGTTSLFGGKRVSKASARIAAYGNVDELNAQIGIILAEDPTKEIAKKLIRIQKGLFVLGSDLATPVDVKTKNSSVRSVHMNVPRVKKSHITQLEKEIDLWSKNLSELKNFILPGGSKIGSLLHQSRTVCRRAERSITVLSQKEKINKNCLIYINRLSDWFFVAARHINKQEKVAEVVWKGRSK